MTFLPPSFSAGNGNKRSNCAIEMDMVVEKMHFTIEDSELYHREAKKRDRNFAVALNCTYFESSFAICLITKRCYVLLLAMH